MQTFLPYKDPTRSARVLDNKRLSKQRVEAVQILNTLLDDTKAGWKNHPAVLMWAGYEKYSLEVYLKAMLDEWASRGYKSPKTLEHYERLSSIIKNYSLIEPPWVTKKFCDSHKSNLIRKKPEYYSNLWPNMPNNLEYIWPVKK
jgi:hypothetical protein